MTFDEFKYRLSKLPEQKDLVGLCEEFLMDREYRVIPPMEIKDFGIRKYTDLVTLFYDLYNEMYTDPLPPSDNRVADNKIASNFVNSRKSLGSISRLRALKECALIIKTVVLHKDEIGVQGTLGFWMFGTDSCRWITGKALEILAMEDRAERLIRWDEILDEKEMNDSTPTGWADLDDLVPED